MLEWYKDKDLTIYFGRYPVVSERYVYPDCTDDEKKNIFKKPYENIRCLIIKIIYKDKKYSFVIPAEFCFDGASIPRLFWRVIGSNTDNTFLVAAMVHDYMCEYHNVVCDNRYLSTLIFNALLKVGGVNPFKRWIMKHSVDNYQKFCGWGK